MSRYFLLILMLLTIMIVACNPASETTQPEPPTLAPTAEAVETPENDIPPTAAGPTEGAPKVEPTEALDAPTITPVDESADEQVAEVTATFAPTPVEEVVINGPYENTYFRGSETAPVTMIDYSDFL